MQAAAMNQLLLNEAGVDASIIEKEIEVQKTNYVKKENQKQC
jgi:translation elongation factor EF-Ts